MFTGEHERLLDEKGRLVLPPNFRHRLGAWCFLGKGSDPCVQLLPAEEVEKISIRLDELTRNGEVSGNTARRWSSSITETKVDAQGRMAIPAKLREAAGLDREVVLVGVFNRAEIWSPEQWRLVQESDDDAIPDARWL